jgi:hypothetical protein
MLMGTEIDILNFRQQLTALDVRPQGVERLKKDCHNCTERRSDLDRLYTEEQWAADEDLRSFSWHANHCRTKRSFLCDTIRYDLMGTHSLNAVLPDEKGNEIESLLDHNAGKEEKQDV